MYLEKLELYNFKNYEEVSLVLNPRVNCLLGLNGSGKTNFLDAIYYLAFTKSFLSSPDTQSIRNGSSSFLIRGTYQHLGKQHELLCSVQPGQKKVFREDGVDYGKLSDHIGKYPVVLISPSDIDLVKGGSEERRKFFDSMISQIDHQYLLSLVHYQNTLKQRNSLLRMFQERNYTDRDLLDSYDQQLISTGSVIFEKRKKFIEEFLPLLNVAYSYLVDEKEEARLVYQSQLHQGNFQADLRESFSKDFATQRTSVGIHRDDYSFEFAHGELKRLGSQGQQKSFLVALKLANLEVLRQHKGFCPILLLDDIFDKLDDLRIARLLQLVTQEGFGQLFLTDAGPERTQTMLKELGISSDILTVKEGKITRG